MPHSSTKSHSLPRLRGRRPVLSFRKIRAKLGSQGKTAAARHDLVVELCADAARNGSQDPSGERTMTFKAGTKLLGLAAAAALSTLFAAGEAAAQKSQVTVYTAMENDQL